MQLTLQIISKKIDSLCIKHRCICSIKAPVLTDNEKKIGTLESAEKLGQEVGINLKKKSGNLYKK